MKILDGKSLAKKIKDDVKLSIEHNAFINSTPAPKLAIVLVGNSPASLVYVTSKLKACNYVGIETELFHFDDNIN